jgi:membrane-bound hydrogenase subunit beta
MTDRTYLSPEQILDRLKLIAADAFISERIDIWHEGAKRVPSYHVWLRVDRARFRAVFKELCEIDYPHLAVISGNDIGDTVELLYHFFIYYGVHQKQIMVTIASPLPKDDPSIPTITDIIPGALTSEREKQEMLGVTITGIPDNRRMFLDDDFPAGVYPWRKDETGLPDSMIKQLWDTGREGREDLDREQKPEQKESGAPGAGEK